MSREELFLDLSRRGDAVDGMDAAREVLEGFREGRVLEVLVDDPVLLERLLDLFPNAKVERLPEFGYLHLVLVGGMEE